MVNGICCNSSQKSHLLLQTKRSKAGITYEYKIHAVDDGGLISKTVDIASITALSYKPQKPTLTYSANENTVLLKIENAVTMT